MDTRNEQKKDIKVKKQTQRQSRIARKLEQKTLSRKH